MQSIIFFDAKRNDRKALYTVKQHTVSSVLYSSGAGYRDSDMDDTGRLAV